MDIQSMQDATREAVKKKFGRKRFLVSRAIPHYPQSLEREYLRVVNAYMNLLNKTVSEYLPSIREALAAGSYKRDSVDDETAKEKPERAAAEIAVVSTSIDAIFDELLEDFAKRQGFYGLTSKIEKLSRLTRKLTIAEWKRVVKRTLGIDIMEGYYNGEKFQRLFDKWVADNVGLIKTIPQEALGNMRGIVKTGYLSGASNKTIAKQIQEAYSLSKHLPR